jgi:hypothetical protein
MGPQQQQQWPAAQQLAAMNEAVWLQIGKKWSSEQSRTSSNMNA